MTSEAHRALAYISAARRYGVDVTAHDVDLFLRHRPRMPFAPPGLEVFVGQQDVLSWLLKVGWIVHAEDGCVRLTQLGEAMLNHAEAKEQDAEEFEAVALDPDDHIAYARAVERIAGVGPAMLVDAYFHSEELLRVLQHTEVDRLLTSGRGKGKDGEARLSGLSTALDQLSVEPPFEVRRNDDIHDRFVIPDSGPVLALGTSMGGIGRRFSVMVTLKPPTADQVREAMGAAWADADVVTRVAAVENGEA